MKVSHFIMYHVSKSELKINFYFLILVYRYFYFQLKKMFFIPHPHVFLFFLLSDEKNGLSSRPPSTPTRQNSRRSEGGSDRGERAERSDRGEGSSIGVVRVHYKERGLARIKLASCPQMGPSLNPK